jgi:hypothetical protein
MKNVVFIIRIAAIFLLGIVFVIGLFGEPNEQQPIGTWLLAFIVSKLVAFAALMAIFFVWGGMDCVKAFVKGIFANEHRPEYTNN